MSNLIKSQGELIYRYCLAFLQLGITSFGGPAMVAHIRVPQLL